MINVSRSGEERLPDAVNVNRINVKPLTEQKKPLLGQDESTTGRQDAWIEEVPDLADKTPAWDLVARRSASSQLYPKA